jgi:hypothetical protein
MRAQEFVTEKKSRKRLKELDFMGMSPCTKDCSGHRAGYKWSKARGGVSTASWSNSFNKGAEIAKAGYRSLEYTISRIQNETTQKHTNNGPARLGQNLSC